MADAGQRRRTPVGMSVSRSGQAAAYDDATVPREATEFARFAAVAALALSVWLPAIELGRVALFPAVYGSGFAALVATVVTVPLQLRHVWFGLRGVRPPAGAWTLAALAFVNVAAALVIGAGWLLNFAFVALSVLIVVRWPWAFLLFFAVVLSVGPLAGSMPYLSTSPSPGGAYLVVSVAWRSVTLFVLVWLVGTIRQLDAARGELRNRALVRERLRIDAELRQGLGAALSRIQSRAQSAARGPASVATRELQELVEDARRTLAESRRLVTGYLTGSVRAELDAALILLEAAGVDAHAVVSEQSLLDRSDARSREAVRSAVVHALGDDSLARSVVSVTADDGGELRVLISSVEHAPRLERSVEP